MTDTPATVALYSVGLLGGSIGLALKASGFKGRIIGLSSPSAITTAMDLGCIDEGYSYDELENVLRTVDCLFLCSPIRVIVETIQRQDPQQATPTPEGNNIL